MDAARWKRMQALFYEALEVEPPLQRAFLEAECPGHPTLVDDVLALLDADAHSHALLDRDLARVARNVLGASAPVPEAVGPYRIRGVLGRGGMGVVYRAEREDLGNVVALKVLRDASLSPARRERFTREQRALAQLNHPSIAQIYDAAVLPDGTPYFVMEYVEGVALTAYCRAHACTLSVRLGLFRAVCEAVQHAHQHAVVHRDLKPSNILVAEHGPGGKPAVKLLDFGVAKQLADLEDAPPAAPPQDMLPLMTPAYAAPEQFRGEPVGVYTDVYALGLILYELLAGRLPFDAAALEPGQIEALKAEGQWPAPSVRARRVAGNAESSNAESSNAEGDQTEDSGVWLPAISRRAWADLDALCLKALRCAPRERYASAEALLRDLERFQRNEPLGARPATPGYRAGKFLRRHRQPMAAAALAVAVIASLVAFYTLRLAGERDRAQAEAAKAEQVSEYLIGLFEAGDPFTPNPDSLDVRALLERGIERAEKLSGQPAVQAQMLNTLGRVHMQLSQYDRADALLRRALALRSGPGGAPLDAAETLTSRAELYKLEGRYDSAEVFVREALALQEERLSPPHPDLARTLHALGSILNNQGEHEEGETYHRLALRMQRALYADAPHEDLAATLNDLGVCLFDQGQYDAAERYFRESITTSRVVYGPSHPSTAIDLANLGVLLDTRGEYAAADSMLTETLRIKRQALGTDHYETAFALSQLGGMLQRKGDYERAERLLREALAVEERVLEPGHRNTGVTLNHLALTLQEQGRHDEAEPLLRRAIGIFEESVGAEHPFVGVTRCHLARLLHQQGQPGVAQPLFRASAHLLREALPAGHDLTALCESKYGALLADQQRFAEAESLLTRSHATLEAQLGPDHESTHTAARRAARLYEAWDKPEKATPFRAALGDGKKP